MKAFTKTVAIAYCLIPEAVALRVSNLCDNPELQKVTEADEVKGQLQLLEEHAKNQNYISLEDRIRIAEENGILLDANNLFRLAARQADTLDQRNTKRKLLDKELLVKNKIADVSLDIPEWMHFEEQTDKFSCYRHTLNNLLNLLVPEGSRDWEWLSDAVAFPTHEDLVAYVGEDGRDEGWCTLEIAPVLFEKSEHRFGMVYVDESEIPSCEPTDGRCYKRGNKNHATFIYHQPKADGHCLAGWKKVCSNLGMTHFNNWEECRKELLHDVSKTMQVVSRGDSCFQDRFGRPVPVCSVPLPIDDFQGSELYVKASTADQLVELGDVYRFGWGVSKDYAKVFSLYYAAAARGHFRVQYDLGRMCMLGQGVQKDYHMAAKWFRLAAELGDSDAQWMLGKFYENGWGGVDKDLAEALKLYQQAAMRGDKNAQGRIQKLLEENPSLSSNP